MNRIKALFVILVIAATASIGKAGVFSEPCQPAMECSPCDAVLECAPCDDVLCDTEPGLFGRKACGKKSLMDQFKFYGWIQAGINVNSHGNKNIYSDAPGPASRNLSPLAGNSYILGFAQPADMKVNQLWFGVTKAKDTRHGWDWGFQADFMFGTDAKYAQCFGDQTFDYGWGSGDYYDAFVQLYAELGYKDLTLRVGKFATLMSYEAVPGPASFFYSHAYLCYNGPLTHNGAMAEYKFNDKWSVTAGWTAGYHNSLENPLNDNALLAQIRYAIDKDSALTYTIYQGWHNGYNDRSFASAVSYNRTYRREEETTMTLRYATQLNKRWFYMIEGLWSQGHMYDVLDATLFNHGNMTKKSYGINQHLIYTINKKWSAGVRFEWLSGKGTFCDIAPITGAPASMAGQGTDLYEITFAVNWNVLPNVNIRPELRYDWSFYKGGFKPFGNGTESDQLMGGCAVTWSF